MRVSVPTIDGVPVLLPPHVHLDFGDPGRHYHVDFRFCPDAPDQGRVIFSEADPVYTDLEAVRPDGYRVDSSAMRVALLLAREYRDARVSDCGRCPHKGLPVFGRQCVGHGLTFDGDGRPVRSYLLRAGGATLPVIPSHTQYTFIMPAAETVDGVELVTPDGFVVARAVFPGNQRIYVRKGDCLNVTIP